MLIAVKENREYKITEAEQEAYLAANYFIYKLEKGKCVLVKAPESDAGKLKAENSVLKAELETLKKTLERQKAQDKANSNVASNEDKKAAK